MTATVVTPSRVLAALARHIGVRNAARATQLVQEILGGPSDAVSERALRHVVADLRMQGHHICARPDVGYFIAQTPEELDETCEFLYERAMTSLAQIARMKKISLPDLRGQLHLPT